MIENILFLFFVYSHKSSQYTFSDRRNGVPAVSIIGNSGVTWKYQGVTGEYQGVTWEYQGVVLAGGLISHIARFLNTMFDISNMGMIDFSNIVMLVYVLCLVCQTVCQGFQTMFVFLNRGVYLKLQTVSSHIKQSHWNLKLCLILQIGTWLLQTV